MITEKNMKNSIIATTLLLILVGFAPNDADAAFSKKRCATLSNWIEHHYSLSRKSWDKLGYKTPMSDGFYLDGWSSHLGLNWDDYKVTEHNVHRKKWDYHERQASDLSKIFSAMCK